MRVENSVVEVNVNYEFVSLREVCNSGSLKLFPMILVLTNIYAMTQSSTVHTPSPYCEKN